MPKKLKNNNPPKASSFSIQKEADEFRKAFAKTMLDLTTSGFGLVAALAWNELIKDIITTYIQPFFGASSGIVTRLIYAVIVTLLAVLVTYNLSKIVGRENE